MLALQKSFASLILAAAQTPNFDSETMVKIARLNREVANGPHCNVRNVSENFLALAFTARINLPPNVYSPMRNVAKILTDHLPGAAPDKPNTQNSDRILLAAIANGDDYYRAAKEALSEVHLPSYTSYERGLDTIDAPLMVYTHVGTFLIDRIWTFGGTDPIHDDHYRFGFEPRAEGAKRIDLDHKRYDSYAQALFETSRLIDIAQNQSQIALDPMDTTHAY